MQTTGLKLTEIQKDLYLLPEPKLDEVKDFIEFILFKSLAQEKCVVQLKGIWANKGFEKIDNLEAELKELRREMVDSMLKKEL